ncbi:MAG: phosphoribosylformylglycinamidine synthase, phosphoribosylformylglycinamidine synthase [Candidatus Gottesmanbacteria bacterium GW2011_GWA2_43_14]|uniref:Phosphoribosylformylglycinamidine synthase, phosphoribosylformylglycinamidine synthase n=1 Tax=Candidatus Gottesmanbacteria bacterium GW2011_GWA2_43_14 TaxID=1618443 RepID=A0A0G1DKV3_9BACT|nr:MAG: phosphoribosylformylglycinamidine synthase, phosphoribosylformylglycinamidine synthase [Candidatus Gottesmanbacteria bacterium GW2011_GWA2_43_14]
MVTRIEVYAKVADSRAFQRQKKLQESGFAKKIKKVFLADVYSIDSAILKKPQEIAGMFANPITESFHITWENSKQIYRQLPFFNWAFEINFLPGVTDNIAITSRESIEDFRKMKFKKGEGVYSSQITFIEGVLTAAEINEISHNFYNPLIEIASLKRRAEYINDEGMDFFVPKVKLNSSSIVLDIDLDVNDNVLADIGKTGIKDRESLPRGPLALDLPSLKEIRKYFHQEKRAPTDIELESLAQTWSEHCKHIIFSSSIDEVKDGLYKTYIKGATSQILKKKKNFAASVFTDNSGAIHFDGDYLVTHKVETHNSPSALDPFGGAVTGIVGVNRDTIGFGLGAMPIANFYGFCVADPDRDEPLYKGTDFTQKMLSSRRILEGIVSGVNTGGNQSGIPTSLGFLYCDEKFRGKPLVFVGTIGLIPKKSNGRILTQKNAKKGDYIVMIGGRVGKDGIHGATFSSEIMNSASPVTAVQIGNPIIQKKFSDALVKEARDRQLYHSITDNGAGGLSCSVAEMARESGGCQVELDQVPLKYDGLKPWEIWISESQERMTLAVPPNKWSAFKKLIEKRGIEATAIGKFTSSGRCVVNYFGKTIMDMELKFLHEGYPKKKLKTRKKTVSAIKDSFGGKKPLQFLFKLLGNPPLCGFEFISSQYDCYFLRTLSGLK